jgi:hypothetical protein
MMPRWDQPDCSLWQESWLINKSTNRSVLEPSIIFISREFKRSSLLKWASLKFEAFGKKLMAIKDGNRTTKYYFISKLWSTILRMEQ